VNKVVNPRRGLMVLG